MVYQTLGLAVEMLQRSFYALSLGPVPTDGKWRVGNLVVFAGFLHEDGSVVVGETVTCATSLDQITWTPLGTSVTKSDGTWAVTLSAIPSAWAGKTVYFRAGAPTTAGGTMELSVQPLAIPTQTWIAIGAIAVIAVLGIVFYRKASKKAHVL